MAENLESLGELAKNLNLVRNKQLEIFDRIQALEERVQDLTNRYRPLDDRLVRLEKASSLGGPGYGR